MYGCIQLNKSDKPLSLSKIIVFLQNKINCSVLFIMKRLFFNLIVLMTTVALLDSCSSAKHVAYFQNIDNVDLSASQGLYDAKIMPKDMLSIIVNTTNPDAARPFNLYSVAGGNTTATDMQGYLVDNSGNINFPVIGKVHVSGLTKGQCEDLIREKIMPYMSGTENPVVTVRMSSFRVTVSGEVNSPGVVPVNSEKMSVIEALAQAGDLTIYGKRDNVLLIRENELGQKSQVRINLNDANFINSPYYYVQQNDIIYVQPNGVKAKSSSIGTSTTLWISGVSILTSLASLVVNILRN